MHFSIPETQEIISADPRKGSPYVVYNINVNGTFHCFLRYKQLYNFHEQLKRMVGSPGCLPTFPPKTIFSLNQKDVEERRCHLEKYIQIVSQNPKISKSQLFNGFFLSAQLESSKIKSSDDVWIDVFLPHSTSSSPEFNSNGAPDVSSDSIGLKIKSCERSSSLLAMALSKLNVPNDLWSYFSLFVEQEDNNTMSSGSNIQKVLKELKVPKSMPKKYTLIRRLLDLESPYVTMMHIRHQFLGLNHRIVIRTSYWDTSLYDDVIMRQDSSLRILYKQSLADVERGCIQHVSKEVRHQLNHFKESTQMKEYIDLTKTLKFYSFLHFSNCISDYPNGNTDCIISLGSNQLIIRTVDTAESEKEYNFKVTRIRCWRLTTTTQLTTGQSGHKRTSAVPRVSNREPQPSSPPPQLELSFEYLMSAESLKWFNIRSEQAIMISMSLQGMIEELLMIKNKSCDASDATSDHHISNGNSGHHHRNSWSFLNRDGKSRSSIISSSSTASLSSSASTSCHPFPKTDASDVPKSSEPNGPVDTNGHEYSSIERKGVTTGSKVSTTLHHNHNHHPLMVVENDAFDTIGDDDL